MSATHEGFTPGPWRAVEFADGGEVVDANGYEVADLNTGCIAINRNWLDTHDEHWSGGGQEASIERSQDEIDANARLIADAPRLYAETQAQAETIRRLREALGKTCDLLEHIERSGYVHPDGYRISYSPDGALVEGRAALASTEE